MEANEERQERHDADNNMDYDYKTAPSWYLSILLGLQHFLSMCTSNAISTLILVENLCLERNSPIKSQLISTSFFVMGISTLLQTFFGVRLPIIQGGTFIFLIPCNIMMTMPDLRSCIVSNNTFIQDYFKNQTMPESVFHVKIRLITGALLVSSLVEIIIPVSGLLGFFTKLISPLSLAAIYTTLCLSISESLIGMMGEQWMIGVIGMIITIIMSAVLVSVSVPIPLWSKASGWKLCRIKIFQISPIILAIIIVWLICGLFTITGVFSKNIDGFGHLARTDIRMDSIYNAPIFSVPYPNQWGSPILMPSIVIGISLGVILSVIESVGDYMVTAQVCNAPKIPKYSTNRGILMEGIGVLLSGLLGSAVAPTSYTGNIGVLKMTRAGHVSVAQVAAVIMILCGLFPVACAIFVSIPYAVVGGVIFVVCMMIMSCAISNFQYINLISPRNGLIFGLSVTMGIYIPQWCSKPENQNRILTGNKNFDDVVQILLSINLFISAALSIFLDKILPGYYNKDKHEEVEILEDYTDSYTYLEACLAYDFILLKWMSKKWPWLQHLSLFPPYKRLENQRDIENDDLKMKQSKL